MSAIRISQEKLDKKVTEFIKFKIPFKKISTSTRTTLITDGFGTFENKESAFPANELHFIKSVKDYVVKNKTYQKVRNYFRKDGSEKRIKYFYYNKTVKPGDIFEGCYEVDIKNCYWDTAYFHYNLFSKEIYEKGLTVSKKSRLAAIGAFAKIQLVVEFDGKNQKKLPNIRSKKTEFLWHTICHKIGKTIYKSSKLATDDFLFFWVDGVFLKSKSQVKTLQKFLKKNGYQSSVSYCEWIKFENNGLTVKSIEKGKWVIEKERIPFIGKDGKKYVRIKEHKVWKDERPFPYVNAMSDGDIINLNS